MRYVTRWQMTAARSQLTANNQTVAEIAHAFGYESEAAFNRAFKREFGVPPARFRDRSKVKTKAGAARSAK